MHQQNCSLCASLKDYERGEQKSGEGTFLPQAAAQLTVLYDLQPRSFDLGGHPPLTIASSRLTQLWECPECQTFYLYREDYEFLWGGTEDEQILERLTDEQVLACLEKLELTRTNPVQSSPPSPQLAAEESFPLAAGENKNYMAAKLEAALAGGDQEEMAAAFQQLEDEAYYYPALIPVLERVAGAVFYYFDDNGAGGFPRPDVRRGEVSFSEQAWYALEKIKEKLTSEAATKNKQD